LYDGALPVEPFIAGKAGFDRNCQPTTFKIAKDRRRAAQFALIEHRLRRCPSPTVPFDPPTG
jgi:hypothetical protein